MTYGQDDDDDDDDFDPVIANSQGGLGLQILVGAQVVKVYKNKWVLGIMNSENKSETQLIILEKFLDDDAILEKISDEGNFDSFYYQIAPYEYYMASVSRNFENLFISMARLQLTPQDFIWNDSTETTQFNPRIQYKFIHEQGFFGKGGWTSAVKIDE
jgi:hypothetical protein